MKRKFHVSYKLLNEYKTAYIELTVDRHGNIVESDEKICELLAAKSEWATSGNITKIYSMRETYNA